MSFSPSGIAWVLGSGISGVLFLLSSPLGAEPVPQKSVTLDQDLEQASPVLRRWLERPPDLLSDIENDQAFPTRLGVGIGVATSRRSEVEYLVSLQDVVLARTRLSLSSDFLQGNADNQQWGANARYYLAPLGSYWNLAAQAGYRSLQIEGNSRSGAEVGAKLLFALAPRAADIALSQSWVLSTEGDSVGRTLLEFGYTLSPALRVTAVIHWVNSTIRRDTSFGLNVELISF